LLLPCDGLDSCGMNVPRPCVYAGKVLAPVMWRRCAQASLVSALMMRTSLPAIPAGKAYLLCHSMLAGSAKTAQGPKIVLHAS